MQEFILSLLWQGAVIPVRGNHEDLCEEMITIDEGLPVRHHKSSGTYGTALQLTGYDPGEVLIRRRARPRGGRFCSGRGGLRSLRPGAGACAAQRLPLPGRLMKNTLKAGVPFARRVCPQRFSRRSSIPRYAVARDLPAVRGGHHAAKPGSRNSRRRRRPSPPPMRRRMSGPRLTLGRLFAIIFLLLRACRREVFL